MRLSQYLIHTTKETPSDAEVISHQLMLRAGLIRKMASGLYNWTPLGLRVVRNVEKVVREEMNRIGTQEMLMPVVQPSELWEESGRWEQYGPELARLKDRHGREFCLGPTHEEVITDFVRNEISSYKQLPLSLYQIQTKFRDEIRPRFGVMRSREFIMKDAYSFHTNQESLQATYDAMYNAYSAIFSRLGLDFRAVLADTGSIGGSASHEFHVLADSGEDDIAFSTESDFAANIELAEAVALAPVGTASGQPLEVVATPGVKTISEVSSFLKLDTKQTVKTLIAHGTHDDEGSYELVALVVRGDHELNELKAEKLEEVHSPLTFASEEEVLDIIGAPLGSIGPRNLPIKVIADRTAALMVDFCAGANVAEKHLINANWGDELPIYRQADIRNVVAGDPSPCGKGQLEIKRGIEVGHIFQLGNKYSTALKCSVLNENGKDQVLEMGCYGIGITRVVASAIEQNHDDNGIIWPEALAPFQLAIVPINYHKSDAVRAQCNEIHNALTAQGIDVLLMDGEKARLGGMLADVELIGIPHRVVVGDRGLEKGEIEYRHRAASENEALNAENIIEQLTQKLGN